MLPEILESKIEELLEGRSWTSLAKAYERLSLRYRKGLSTALSEEERIAYVAVRLPATFAAVSSVLEELGKRLPTFAPRSVWDLGCGPGGALSAACQNFPSLLHCIATERDPELLALARSWLPQLGRQLSFYNEDLRRLASLPEAVDLALFSYSWGEVRDTAMLSSVWQRSQILLVVEPGTPEGYRRMLQARSHLIDSGAHIIAPCPHNLACPLPKEDWCHFSIRLPRRRYHRFLKGGDMGYEDEKFSYCIAAKQPIQRGESCILAPPHKEKAGLQLKLCTPAHGLQFVRLPRSDPNYSKRLRWGDVILTPDNRRSDAL